MAGLMKPMTEGLLNVGGLPALAGIYGLVSGSNDFRNIMTKKAFRFPLPVMIDGEFVMPPSIAGRDRAG